MGDPDSRHDRATQPCLLCDNSQPAHASASSSDRPLPPLKRTVGGTPQTAHPLHKVSCIYCGGSDRYTTYLVSLSSVSSACIIRMRFSTTSGVSSATSTAISFTARGLQEKGRGTRHNNILKNNSTNASPHQAAAVPPAQHPYSQHGACNKRARGQARQHFKHNPHDAWLQHNPQTSVPLPACSIPDHTVLIPLFVQAACVCVVLRCDVMRRAGS